MTMARTLQFGAARVSYRSWTPAQEHRLIELAVEAHCLGQPRGAYLAQFAGEFDSRDLGALKARAHRLLPEIEDAIAAQGAKAPAKPDPNAISEFDAQLIALTRAGLTSGQIAEQLGRSLGSIRDRLSRLRRKRLLPMVRNVQNRADLWTQAELMLLVAMHRAGHTQAEIGAAVTAQNGGFPVRSADSVRSAVARLREGAQFAGVADDVDLSLSGAALPVPDVSSGAARFAVPGVTGSLAEVARVMAQAPVRGVPRGLTAAQTAVVVRDHLDFVAGVAVFGNFDAQADLRLCEGLWRAESLIQLAALLGVSEGQARARWRLITAPWADDRGHVPLGVAEAVLPALRERASHV